MAAGYLDYLAGEHPGLLACKEKYGVGNFFRSDELSHRDYRKNRLLEVLVNPSCLGRSRCHTVHGEAVIGDLQGNTAGKGLQGGLAGSVGNRP